MGRLFSLFGIGLLSTCSVGVNTGVNTTDRLWAPNAPISEYAPPEWYREVWQAAVDCAKKTRPTFGDTYDEIVWFNVYADSFQVGSRWVLAAYTPYTGGRRHRIYMGRLARIPSFEPTAVAHEAIHASTLIFSHPPDLYGRCP